MILWVWGVVVMYGGHAVVLVREEGAGIFCVCGCRIGMG